MRAYVIRAKAGIHERPHDDETARRLHPGQPAQRYPVHGGYGRPCQTSLGTSEWPRRGIHETLPFEVHDHINEAIQREKRIKNWNRAWKIALVEESNPEWHDLWPTIIGDEDVDSRFRGNDEWGERE